MPFDAKTMKADLDLLKTYVGPDTNEDILDQLRELARQVRAMQGLIAGMAGEREPTASAPLGKAVSSENRVVLLRKAVLGPHGGQAILYDKTLASRLLAKGLISSGEHKIWKVSGLLPERVNLRDARPEPFLMSRPA